MEDVSRSENITLAVAAANLPARAVHAAPSDEPETTVLTSEALDNAVLFKVAPKAGPLTERTAAQMELLDALAAAAAKAGVSTVLIDKLRRDLAASTVVAGRTDAPSLGQFAASAMPLRSRTLLDPAAALPVPPAPDAPRPPDPQVLTTTRGTVSAVGLTSRERYGRPNRDALIQRVPTSIDPSTLNHATMLVGCMDPAYRLKKVGLALSGGGSHGDFQLGAIRYIYDNFLGGGVYHRPDIVTGTSVGAINGTKLSEGAATSLAELENTWAGLHRNADMYRLNGSWDTLLRRALDDSLNILWPELLTLVLSGGAGVLPLIVALFSADALRSAAGEWVRQLETIKALFNLDPIRSIMRQEIPYWSMTGPGRRGAGVCAGHDHTGRPVVIARGYDDGCYISVLTDANRWSAWIWLGMRISGDPAVLTDETGAVSALIVHSTDDRRYHMRPVRTGADIATPAGWSDWAPMGYPPLMYIGEPQYGGPTFEFDTAPTVVRGPNHTWYIYGVGREGFVWYNQWRAESGHFTGWQPLGSWPPIQTTNPAAGVTPRGAVHYLGRLRSGELVQTYETPFAGGNWTHVDGVTATGTPTIAANGDGALHAFCIGTDNRIRVRVQHGPDGAWSSWRVIGDSATSNIAAVLTPNNALSIFVRGLDYSVWTKTCTSADGQWSAPDAGWVSLGTPEGVRFLTDPAATRSPDGLRDVYCVGNDRHVYLNREAAGVNGYSWSGWHSLGGSVWTGVELRLATISLETGVARYVDEAGRFTDSVEPLVGVDNATMASAAIPAIFNPVVMNGQTYVDGGVRDGIPIWAAIDAGADVVYAIECSAPLSLVQSDPDHRFDDPVLDFAARLDGGFDGTGRTSLTDAGIGAIAVRAIMDVMPNSIVRNQLEPHQPWPVPVYVIQPSWDVHDAMTIDQGLIQIAHAYGWMRASDVLASGDPASAMPASDLIMVARRESWQWEAQAHATILRVLYPPEGYPDYGYGWDGPNVADLIQRAREAKRRVEAAVVARRNAGFEVPDDADSWATRWEFPGLSSFSAGPADGFTFTMANGVSQSVPAA